MRDESHTIDQSAIAFDAQAEARVEADKQTLEHLRAQLLGQQEANAAANGMILDDDMEDDDPAEEINFLIRKSQDPAIVDLGLRILEEGTDHQRQQNCYAALSHLAIPWAENGPEITIAQKAQRILQNRLNKDFERAAARLREVAEYSRHWPEEVQATFLHESLEAFTQKVDSLIACQDRDTLEGIAYIVLKATTREDQSAELTKFFVNYFGRFGLNARQVFSVWRDSFENGWHEKNGTTRLKDFANKVARNFLALHVLYAHDSGSPRVLAERFNILIYGRYSTEQLITQYNERDNVDQRYGVAIYARVDNNGALYDFASQLKDLQQQLEAGQVSMRIVECDSIVRLAGTLSHLDTAYNQSGTNKILFPLLIGHGNINLIRLGKKGPQGIATIKPWQFETDQEPHKTKGSVAKEWRLQAIQQGAISLKKFFIDNPSVPIVACLTGKEGGLANRLSQSYSASVVGPDNATALKGFSVTWQDQLPRISVTYTDAEARLYEPTEKT